jgi:hypothetical protein
MEAVKPITSMIEDKQIRKALLPNLSIAAPRKGLAIAEMMYGIPKR